MGMYNRITCNVPLPGPYSKKLTGQEFQTKSIDPNSMDRYKIGDDKKLYKLMYDTIHVGTNSLPGLPGITFPSFKRVNEHWVEATFDGEMRFYNSSDCGTLWHEYVATFKDGVMLDVKKDMYRSRKLGKWVKGEFKYGEV